MENAIVIGVIAGIVALAILYVIRAKKQGKACIGCPEGGCGSCSGCCHRTKK